tara:strand:- start:5018 stop:6916 length:1899 start_codon:yes stop_codon:yes gene_type:complete
MNSIELQNFIKSQILLEQKLFLENQSLTESQKADKVVYILCESESPDEEGFYEKIKSAYGGTKQSIKRFLIRRLLGYMGIRMRSVIREPLVGILEKFSFQDIQGVFRGNDQIQRRMAEVSAQAVLDVLKQTVYKQIGVKDSSFLGTPILQAIETVFEKQDFRDLLHQTFIEALVNVSAAIEAKDAPDTDGDGLDGSEEAIAGTDPMKPEYKAEVEVDDEEFEEPSATVGETGPEDIVIPPPEATPEPEPQQPDSVVSGAEKKKREKKAMQNKLKDFARSVFNDKLASGSKKTKNFVEFVRYYEANEAKLRNYLEIVAQDISAEEKVTQLHAAGYVTDAGLQFFQNLSNTADENVAAAQSSENSEQVVAAASATVEDPEASEEQKSAASAAAAETVEDLKDAEPEAQGQELDPDEIIDLDAEKSPSPTSSRSPGRAKPTAVSEIRDDILKTLQDSESPLGINDIAKKMGIMGGVDVLKSELEQMDQVVKQGDRYRVKTEEDVSAQESKEIYPFKEHIGVNSGKDETVLERELKRIMLKVVKKDGTIDKDKINTFSKPLERDPRKAKVVADIINYMSEEEDYEGMIPDDEEDLMMEPSSYIEELVSFILLTVRGSGSLDEEFNISSEIMEKILS